MQQTQVVWRAYISTDWSIFLAYFQGEFLKLSPLESMKCKCPAKHFAENLKNIHNSYQLITKLITLYVVTNPLWMTFLLFGTPVFPVIWYYSLCILLRASSNPHDQHRSTSLFSAKQVCCITTPDELWLWLQTLQFLWSLASNLSDMNSTYYRQDTYI